MMPTELLQLWETGENQHPLDRALLLLGHARPDSAWSDLAALNVGRRDAGLLELRQRWFGSRLEGFAGCPHCSEGLEFTLSLPELLNEPPPSSIPDTLTLEGFDLEFRLPDSQDLALAAQASSPAEAYQTLLEHLVVARRDGQEVSVSEVPGEVLATLEGHMAELDPQAEILLDMQCPVCSQTWQAALDAGEFVWAEVRSAARHLMTEVHLLASAYGWSESQILNLSPQRRQAYLAQVTA